MRDMTDLLNRKLVAHDGKEVITVEELMQMRVRHPEPGYVTLRLNCTTILFLLGLENPGCALRTRATSWLHANGFQPTGNGKIWKVVIGHAPDLPYHVV